MFQVSLSYRQILPFWIWGRCNTESPRFVKFTVCGIKPLTVERNHKGVRGISSPGQAFEVQSANSVYLMEEHGRVNAPPPRDV